MSNTTKMSEHISCPECKEEGKRILHTYLQFAEWKELGNQWSWHLMNHDKTSKFQWPDTFATKASAKAHLNSVLGEDLL